jgi:ribosome-binding factor A
MAVSERLNQLSNHQTLITLTRGVWSKDKKVLTILVSVLPEQRTAEVLEFLMRNKDELRGALFNTLKLARVPYLLFENDEGEDNLQSVHEALQ